MAGVVHVLDIDPDGNVTNTGITIPVVVFWRRSDRRANVLVHSNSRVTVIDTNSNTIIGTIPLANNAQAGGIAVIP